MRVVSPADLGSLLIYEKAFYFTPQELADGFRQVGAPYDPTDVSVVYVLLLQRGEALPEEGSIQLTASADSLLQYTVSANEPIGLGPFKLAKIGFGKTVCASDDDPSVKARDPEAVKKLTLFGRMMKLLGLVKGKE